MNERFLIAQIIRANVIGIRQAEADDFSPRSYLDELDKLVNYLEAEPEGEIVVTKNQTGQIVAVTRQDEEGRILKVIAESAAGVGVPAGRLP